MDIMNKEINLSQKVAVLILNGFMLLPILIYTGWLPDDTSWVLSLYKYRPFYFAHISYLGHGDRFQPFFNGLNQFLSYISFKPIIFFLCGFIIAFMSIALLIWLAHKLFDKFWYFPLIIILTTAFSSHFYSIHTAKELLLLWSLFLALFFIPLLKNEKKPPNYIFF